MQRPVFLPAASIVFFLCGCPGGDGDSAGQDTTSGGGGILPPVSSDPGASSTSGPEPTGGPATGDAGTASDGDTAEDYCDHEVPVVDPVVPRVMLVLDKSGSMVAEGQTSEPGELLDGYWDHDGDPNTPEVTRWMSLHSVVESMVQSLDEVIHFGAVLFPSLTAKGAYNLSACPVDPEPLVPIGPGAGAAILAALPPADTTTIAGGTPATAGMLVAIDELQSLQDDEPKFIILVTDGAANCKMDTEPPDSFEDYDDLLPLTVADALTKGFKTFVIGIDIQDVTSPVAVDGSPDNTNTYEKLNEIAELGGTARPGAEKFYNAVNQIELQAALMEIIGETLSCTVKLGDPLHSSLYIELVQIGADGDPAQQNYPGYDTQVKDCATESGWQYTSPARDEIVLCGAACDYYKATGVINIEFGCSVG
ncbi:MAG TPA: hypothetical protein VIK91_09255 [Nannocystis sp.]